MKVCDESLYHEIAVIYCFLHLYERMETMEGEALDFITRDFDAWKWRREPVSYTHLTLPTICSV